MRTPLIYSGNVKYAATPSMSSSPSRRPKSTLLAVPFIQSRSLNCQSSAGIFQLRLVSIGQFLQW